MNGHEIVSIGGQEADLDFWNGGVGQSGGSGGGVGSIQSNSGNLSFTHLTSQQQLQAVFKVVKIVELMVQVVVHHLQMAQWYRRWCVGHLETGNDTDYNGKTEDLVVMV